ncbi:hypothetical protein [Cupriavidus necator]|uniref:hypothetical protein n=1 Tax=Cupriavidus necator TaxID=106590 RepID=UPI0039C2A03B
MSVYFLLGSNGLAAAQGRPVSYSKVNAEYQKLFRLADANQDGRLSLSEARARIPRLLKEFSALDADADGTLSRGEYATYVQPLSAAGHQGHINWTSPRRALAQTPVVNASNCSGDFDAIGGSSSHQLPCVTGGPDGVTALAPADTEAWSVMCACRYLASAPCCSTLMSIRRTRLSRLSRCATSAATRWPVSPRRMA